MAAGEQAETDEVGPEVLSMLAERYDDLERIGAGGVGVVYRSVLREMNLPVAIKVLRPQYASNQEILARFQREAATASSIGNPHIVRMVELASLPNGSAYIAMEYLEGQSLGDHIAQGALSSDETMAIGLQIMDALGACHERGVVHRDLKPDNILLVEQDGRPSFVKVVDFGMARLVGSAAKLTNQGAIIGTPHYMAPEQCKGQPADHRADIYAVGILLYRMLTGKLPFDGDKWLEVLSQQVHTDPVPPSQHMEEGAMPPGLQDVILKAMQKDPDQRFQTMQEMMDSMERVSSIDLFAEPPPDGSVQAGDPAGGAAMGTAVWLGGLALLALLALGAGALWWLRG